VEPARRVLVYHEQLAARLGPSTRRLRGPVEGPFGAVRGEGIVGRRNWLSC
jgi:hypothetical protein